MGTAKPAFYLWLLLAVSVHAQPASLDLSFAPTNGANKVVLGAAAQADGRIIISGSFDSFAGVTAYALARLNADGTLDSYDSRGLGFQVSQVLMRPDGEALIGGPCGTVGDTNYSDVTALTASGAMDDSLLITVSNYDYLPKITNMRLDLSGRILVAGSFHVVNGAARTNVARLWPDGTLDVGFPGDSISYFNSGGTFQGVAQAAPQTDGKIVVAGGSFTVNSVFHPYVARLNSDGTLDQTFGTNNGFNSPATALAVRSDGKVVFAVSGGFGWLTTNGQSEFGVSTPGGTPYCLAEQSDRKFLVGGSFTNIFTNNVLSGRKYIARFNVDGSLDSTFNPALGPNAEVRSINVLPDGRILLTGDFTNYDGQPRGRVAILQGGPFSGPAIDTNPPSQAVAAGQTVYWPVVARALPSPDYQWFFNSNAIPNATNQVLVVKNLRATNAGNYSVLISNSLGVASSQLAVLSVLPVSTDAGKPDVDFYSGDGPNAGVGSIAVQPDGKILIAGSFDHVDGLMRKRVARLNSDGSLDPSFDPGTGPSAPFFSFISDLVPLNGKILVGGYFQSFGPIPRGGIARLNDDGTVDASFDAGAGGETVRRILLQGTNILIGGFFSSIQGISSPNLARLFPNGTADTNYISGLPSTPEVYALGQQSSGKVIAGLKRLNLDGSVDNTFAPQLGLGVTNTDCFVPAGGGGHPARLNALCVQTDDKIVIAGFFHLVNNVSRYHVARLNANGSLDTTFGSVWSGTDSSVNSVVLLPDGKILIGGCFHKVNGTNRNGIARLNADGGLDLGFDPGGGISGSASPIVNALATANDGRVLVGGYFTQVNGMPRNNFAQLYGDFTLFNPVRTGTTFSVSLPTSSQKTYFLEFKDSFLESNWSSLPGVAGDGTAQTLTDSSATNSERFYRIRAQ